MREVIRDIPDGRYVFTDWIDGVGEDPEPLKITVGVTVAGDEITSTSPARPRRCPAAINCPIAMVRSGRIARSAA